jgi:hypothetical protein
MNGRIADVREDVKSPQSEFLLGFTDGDNVRHQCDEEIPLSRRLYLNIP